MSFDKVENIVVCIKQVPDTSEVKIDQKTGTLIRQGVPSIINPDDKSALELALKLKDKNGAKVTAITMGPPQAKDILREAYSMGADRAILITDRAFAGADTLATSYALSSALKKINYDIILCGRQAIDGDTAQVGPEIAEHLNIPQITYVEELDVKGDKLIVKKVLENGYEILETNTPSLLTVIAGNDTPRYMNARYIFKAFAKDIEEWNSQYIEVDKNKIGLMGSPTKVKSTTTKELKGKGQIVNDNSDELSEIIYKKLKEQHLI